MASGVVSWIKSPPEAGLLLSETYGNMILLCAHYCLHILKIVKGFIERQKLNATAAGKAIDDENVEQFLSQMLGTGHR